MRRTFIPLVLTVLLFLAGGCATRDNPVESAVPPPSSQASTSVLNDDGFTIIKLPSHPLLRKTVSSSAHISVRSGGRLSLKDKFSGGPYGKVSIEVKLKFEPRSLTDDADVSLSIDDQLLLTNVDLTFGPHGLTFLKPASLDVHVKGVDLSSLNGKTPDFCYYNETTGTWEIIQSKKIKVNFKKGEIDCQDALIWHFSIYAFGIIRK